MVNFSAGETLNCSTVVGGMLTSMEALETPGVEMSSTNWVCNWEAPDKIANSTNYPKEHPTNHGEKTNENLLLGNKVGGTMMSEDKLSGRA